MSAHETLRLYMEALSPQGKQRLAEKCQVSLGHLRDVARGKTPGAPLARRIQRYTRGKVKRAKLRTDVY